MSGVSDYSFLPDVQKRQLVIDLLEEFNITRWQETTDGEMHHRCSLNLGGHSNGDNPKSASINYKKLAFNCFVCGHSGGIIWWIAVNRGIEYSEVENWVKSRTGLGGEKLELNLLMQILDGIAHSKDYNPEPLPYYDDRILKQWDWGLQHPYMEFDRHIPVANLERFQIGWDPKDDRIVIPVRWQGKLVGWQGRTLNDDPQKYKNSFGFPRDRVLFTDASYKDEVVVVESPMSVLRHCHQRPMVSTMGGNVTAAQIRLLTKFKRLILWYDNDKAGYNATHHLLRECARSIRVDVVRSPYKDKDPADINDVEFNRIVGTAVPGVLWKPVSPLREYTGGP